MARYASFLLSKNMKGLFAVFHEIVYTFCFRTSFTLYNDLYKKEIKDG